MQISLGEPLKTFFFLCVEDFYTAHSETNSGVQLHQEGWAIMDGAAPLTPQAGLELWEVSVSVKGSWAKEPCADYGDGRQRNKICNLEVFKTCQGKAGTNKICF